MFWTHLSVITLQWPCAYSGDKTHFAGLQPPLPRMELGPEGLHPVTYMQRRVCFRRLRKVKITLAKYHNKVLTTGMWVLKLRFT
jgi:hypothetical protein